MLLATTRLTSWPHAPQSKLDVWRFAHHLTPLLAEVHWVSPAAQVFSWRGSTLAWAVAA